MQNSIPTLATVAECDRQLSLAQTALLAMQFERSQVDQKNGIAVTAGPGYERELQSTQEQIVAYEGAVLTMAAGPGKEAVTNVLRGLYIRRNTLVKKEATFGIDGLFEQQGEYTALGGKIDAFQTFITALNARKAEL